MSTKIKKLIVIISALMVIGIFSVYAINENNNIEYMKYKEFYENVYSSNKKEKKV